MQVSARITRAGRVADTWTTHITAALLFLVANALGYAFAGGLDFVQQWGGGIAATIATGYLVWKLQGYWVWMSDAPDVSRPNPQTSTGETGEKGRSS